MDGLSESIVREAAAPARRKRIVIVGAGFGGLWAATRLGRADADVTVIDRHNYHLFQPLLYQVATAALSPADIAAPIRSILGAPEQYTGDPGHRHRHRQSRPRGAARRPARALRLPGRRHRRARCLFRPRRLGGGHRAAEGGRGCARDAAAHPRRVRARRGQRRRGRAPQAADLCRHRRRPDRGRVGRRARRACARGTGQGLSPHRSEIGAHRAGRGRAAAAAELSAAAIGGGGAGAGAAGGRAAARRYGDRMRRGRRQAGRRRARQWRSRAVP